MFSFLKRKPVTEQAEALPHAEPQAEVPAVNSIPASEVAPPAVAEPLDAQPKRSWTERLKQGLNKTRERFTQKITRVFSVGKLDDESLEALEDILLSADCGVQATEHLLVALKARWKAAGSQGDAKQMLQEELTELLKPLQQPLTIVGAKPFVIMIAGVNGAGKTTSIGKLAKHFQAQGLSVLLAAGDTFRAAAREQLKVWGERNHVTVIAQDGGDPAAVMFDAIAAARARGIDVVLADTAGRLPTQLHLMEEIKKIKRVIQKADSTAPHEVLLVLDATIGQNAITQVKVFNEALGLTGLVMTKLDGSAKGGVIAAIAKEQPIPLRFIGVGEQIDDLRPFVAEEFVSALFDEDAATGDTAPE